jgi:hypothetical protein
MRKRNIKVGDVIIVKNLVFRHWNGKPKTKKDHATNGRPCVVISKSNNFIYVIGVKSKYGYEGDDLKFMNADTHTFRKKSLYQIEEIYKIVRGAYPKVGSIKGHELYDLLYSILWYQYASANYYKENRFYDDTMAEITEDINRRVLNLYKQKRIR